METVIHWGSLPGIMVSFTAFLVLSFATAISAKKMTIAIRNNVTQPCPNVRSDLIDTKSIQMRFQFAGPSAGGNSADQVTVISQNGKQEQFTFPGCYRVQLSFRLKQRLANPYIEAFMQMGTNLPCQSGDQESYGTVPNICTNITRSSWCPQSQDSSLRSMLRSKNTCRFCNLCGTLESEKNTIGRYISPDRGYEKECRTDEQYQTLSFRMCTPSKSELRRANDDHEGKLEEYWNYLRQGVLTAVIHVMDRKPQDSSKLRQCRTMCESYTGSANPSVSYRQTLLKSIEAMCAPKDTYAACVYHTVKFDVYDNQQ